jgi:hypothetical protein
MSPPNRENEGDLLQELRTGRSYTRSVRQALFGLLAGGGLLGGARILRLVGISEALTISATFAEFLGWVFLISSTVILWSEWREQKGLLRGPKDRWAQRRGPALGGKRRAGRSVPLESSREDAIDSLYAELRPLMSRAVSDPTLRGEVEAKLSHLRELQSAEADEMQKRFEAGLLLKPGEGWQALDRANELLARYENSPSPNPPTERHH